MSSFVFVYVIWVFYFGCLGSCKFPFGGVNFKYWLIFECLGLTQTERDQDCREVEIIDKCFGLDADRKRRDGDGKRRRLSLNSAKKGSCRVASGYWSTGEEQSVDVNILSRAKSSWMKSIFRLGVCRHVGVLDCVLIRLWLGGIGAGLCPSCEERSESWIQWDEDSGFAPLMFVAKLFCPISLKIGFLGWEQNRKKSQSRIELCMLWFYTVKLVFGIVSMNWHHRPCLAWGCCS